MLKHLLDGGTTKCSCRGGGCKICNANNRIISLHNDLMSFGASKELIKENLKEINKYVDKVDNYTLYEYLSGQIDEEKLNEEITTYVPKPENPKSIYYSIPTGETNPTKQCVYKKPGVWERCIYCNGIKKFQGDKDCPAYKEKIE